MLKLSLVTELVQKNKAYLHAFQIYEMSRNIDIDHQEI